MKIASFGSCLARRTANNYCRLFGGKVVSSVYHNRSDAFIGRFVKGTWPAIDLEQVASHLAPDVEATDIDDKASLILRNQTAGGIGLHRLNQGIQFLAALDGDLVDLILVDNYMDLAARLITKDSAPGTGIFLRLNDFATPVPGWTLGGHLDPAAGSASMSEICDFLHARSPRSAIVFLNFPHNTYAASPERVARTQEYERLFRHRIVSTVPCLTVHPSFQTKERQHFANDQYCAYAGIVHQLLTVRGFRPTA